MNADAHVMSAQIESRTLGHVTPCHDTFFIV